jgi:hypothetical protein
VTYIWRMGFFCQKSGVKKCKFPNPWRSPTFSFSIDDLDTGSRCSGFSIHLLAYSSKVSSSKYAILFRLVLMLCRLLNRCLLIGCYRHIPRALVLPPPPPAMMSNTDLLVLVLKVKISLTALTLRPPSRTAHGNHTVLHQ